MVKDCFHLVQIHQLPIRGVGTAQKWQGTKTYWIEKYFEDGLN